MKVTLFPIHSNNKNPLKLHKIQVYYKTTKTKCSDHLRRREEVLGVATLLLDLVALGVAGTLSLAATAAFLAGEREIDRDLVGAAALAFGAARLLTGDLAGELVAFGATGAGEALAFGAGEALGFGAGEALAFGWAETLKGVLGPAAEVLPADFTPPLTASLIKNPTAVVKAKSMLPTTLGIGQACQGRSQSRGMTMQPAQEPNQRE